MINNLTLIVTGGTPTGERTADLELVHGRNSTYTHHECRCTKCTLAATAWSANRRRQQAYGRWQPFQDATPVRVHVQALTEVGMTWQQIADRAGVSLAVVRNLLVGVAGRPPSARLRPGNASRLLAVTAPRAPIAAGGARVDATGSRRRLQALVTVGWPQRTLGREADLDQGVVTRITHGRYQRITTGRARTVHDLYDRLWDTDPADHDVPRRHREAARALAARHGWAPPMAWDDDAIDDPATQPDWTARCGTPGGYYDHTQIGTPTCRRCRRAVRDAARERKLRRRNRAA